MAREIETCIEYCEPGWAYMSSNEQRWINQLRKLAAERPDDCIIMKQPENNSGFIYAKFDQKWVRVRPPRESSMTDEQRKLAAERLRLCRSLRQAKVEGLE